MMTYFSRFRRWFTFGLALWGLSFSAHAGLIESFAYPNRVQAQQQWIAQGGSPPILSAEPGAMTVPLPFDEDVDRVYWDHGVTLDLADFDTLHLDVSVPEPESLRALAIYFKSGDGWYIWSRPIREAGRQTLTMMKADFQTEGRPAGWHQIERIRLSPWRGESRRSTLTLHRLAAVNPDVLVVRSLVPEAGERNASRRAAQRVSQLLSDRAVSHAVLDDAELNAERLRRAQVVVLPYAPTLTTPQRRLLREFVQRGGRLMVFYSSDAGLAELLGFRLGEYQAADGPGQWASIRFVDEAVAFIPQRVHQDSWNIRPVYPASTDSRVLAYWDSAQGVPGTDPAWVISPRGAWMTHIVLPGDEANKRDMLAGIMAHLHPDLWPAMASHAIQRAGRIGPFVSFDDALAGLAPGRRAPHRATRNALLTSAEEQHRRLHLLYGHGRFPQTVQVEQALRRTLLEAYARSIAPIRGSEWRAVWDHRGTGLAPGAWEPTMQFMAQHGVNVMLANMLWGGVAHFPSQVLPHSTTYRLYGDQLDQALAAGQRHGVELHAWVVCWSLTGAPGDFVQQMRAEGRLVQDADGQEITWLNPAHPDNVQQLVDSLVDLAQRYPVTGIHLDYIRYPHRRACYSPYTRSIFEAWLGRAASPWPQAALPGGELDEAFRRFRRERIDYAVYRVHQALREVRADLTLSAAVWGGYPQVIDSIGQDWAAWLYEDWLDFVVPMNYAADYAQFMQWTRAQLALPGLRDRIYPGLGVTAAESQLSPDQVIRQISGLREQGARGWALFDLNNTLTSETLPALRMGVTAP